jgi:hypothetical protein
LCWDDRNIVLISPCNRYTYSSKAIFSEKDVTGAIEDMFMWVDKRGNFHTVFHLMYGCGTCGSHAYSPDGIHWTYTGVAYTAKTKFTDGTEVDFPYVPQFSVAATV